MRILGVARSVLAEQGFDFSIADVTRRANVGSGTIYRYYESKQGLAFAVLDELRCLTRAELTAIASSLGDPREDVRRTMCVGFNRLQHYGRLAVAVMAGTEPEIYRCERDHRNLREFLRLLVRRGIAQGCFRARLDVSYAVSIWFAIVAPHTLSAMLQERTVEQIAAMTTDFFLAAITA